MTSTLANGIISSQQLLEIWQSNRGLTRRVINAFSEEELFNFSIGGMRPFALTVKELLAIAVPGLEQIVNGEVTKLEENLPLSTKSDLLKAWDLSTEKINELWSQIGDERFEEEIVMFGEYKNKIISNILYFIENEIHHRGQAYVYLRALDTEPPFFWEK